MYSKEKIQSKNKENICFIFVKMTLIDLISEKSYVF